MIAAEASGDVLGAALIQALTALHPGVRCEGIAGPAMRAACCDAWHPTEALGVMGITEVLAHLPRLLRLRRACIARWQRDPPDVFVGIDAPDFNLAVAARLKAAGVPTVQYVSPSVWAWRPWRVHRIARAVDRVLCLFPFEPAAYAGVATQALHVGHPLGDEIPAAPDALAARQALGLPAAGRMVALLPGSRAAELAALAQIQLRAAALLHAGRPDLGFVAPMAHAGLRDQFERAWRQHAPALPLTLVAGQSRAAMAAADVVLAACGTATLEAMLLARPLVAVYRVSALSHALMRRLSCIRHYALPNLLAGRELVPEFIQDAATPEHLAQAVGRLLDDAPARTAMVQAYAPLRAQIGRGAALQAARAVLELMHDRARR